VGWDGEVSPELACAALAGVMEVVEKLNASSAIGESQEVYMLLFRHSRIDSRVCRVRLPPSPISGFTTSVLAPGLTDTTSQRWDVLWCSGADPFPV
jgi:hypothetical protein